MTDDEATYWEVFKMGMSAFAGDVRRLCSWLNPCSQQEGDTDP